MSKGVFIFLTSAALALGTVAPASAASILFDPDGAGATYAPTNIDLLDPAPGNSFSTGINGNSPVGTTGMLLFQANIANATQGGSSPFVFNFLNDAAPNFTIVAGFNEKVSANTSTGLNFTAPVTDGSLQGFFYIYAQNTTASDLNGVCFVQSCGGTLLATGQIINNANFFGNFDTNVLAPTALLDQFGSDDYAGKQTIVGGGNFSVDVLITAVNQPSYFPNLIPGTTLVLATSQQKLAYQQANPAACFSTNGLTSCNQPGVSATGAVNGLGPNTVLQTDASLSFQAVPEPATMTLLGIGLIGSAAARRRARKNKKS